MIKQETLTVDSETDVIQTVWDTERDTQLKIRENEIKIKILIQYRQSEIN